MPAVLQPLVAQVLPVAVFLVAITVTAEIAQLAGVFYVAAHAMARRARHRVVVLWLLFAVPPSAWRSHARPASRRCPSP